MPQLNAVLSFQSLFLAFTLHIASAVGAVGAPYIKPNTFTTSITLSSTLNTASASNSLGSVTSTAKPRPTCIYTPTARGSTCVRDDPKSAAIGIGIAAGAFILLLAVTLVVAKLRKRALRQRNANLPGIASLAADNISLDAPPPPYTKVRALLLYSFREVLTISQSGPNSHEMHPLPASRAASPPPPEFTVEVPHHEERNKDLRS